MNQGYFKKPSEFDYKEKFTLEQRKEEASRVLKKYKDKIPIVIEKAKNDNNIAELDKHKFIVPRELTLGQFQYAISKRIGLKESQAIFLFVNGNNLCNNSHTISSVYDEHKSECGFLYCTYSAENTFG
jgi:GABA(A) receptor-associated protein